MKKLLTMTLALLSLSALATPKEEILYSCKIRRSDGTKSQLEIIQGHWNHLKLKNSHLIIEIEEEKGQEKLQVSEVAQKLSKKQVANPIDVAEIQLATNASELEVNDIYNDKRVVGFYRESIGGNSLKQITREEFLSSLDDELIRSHTYVMTESASSKTVILGQKTFSSLMGAIYNTDGKSTGIFCSLLK